MKVRWALRPFDGSAMIYGPWCALSSLGEFRPPKAGRLWIESERVDFTPRASLTSGCASRPQVPEIAGGLSRKG